jgi:hypothetical protein
VISGLTAIIDKGRERRTADAYFAALYRGVTAEVQQRVATGYFEDGPRMERLMVTFAGLYLDAWKKHEDGRSPGMAWGVALDASRRYWPLVLQHLLLGINAHINLDLGNAAAQVTRGRDVREIEIDFDRVNQVLADMVDDVQHRLAEVWPPLKWLDGMAGGVDEAVTNFSMRRARDHAWQVATVLSACPDAAACEKQLAETDAQAAELARRVLHPGGRIGLVLKIIRLRERGSVSEKVAVLAGKDAAGVNT